MRSATARPGGGSSNPRGSASRQENQWKGGRKECIVSWHMQWRMTKSIHEKWRDLSCLFFMEEEALKANRY
jgi:hypothetical protein